MTDRPPWPAWFAPIGLLMALGFAIFGAILVAGVAEATGGDAESPASLRFATLVQDVALVSVAVWLAARVRRPAPDQFGLRRTRFWPALGWTALGAFSYLTFGAIYTQLIGEPETQTTLDDLGAKGNLVFVGVMVIVVAPFVEEFFFRGFFYGALRTRFGILAAAAIDGLVFGAIHAFSGPEAVPPLAVLGFVFCLIYERTGSLWPVIVLHALNNWISYGTQTDDGATASVIGVAMVASCLLLAHASRPVAAAGPPGPVNSGP